MKEQLVQLKSAAVLANASKEAAARLKKISRFKKYRKGEFLFLSNEAVCKIFIINKGQVKLFRSKAGKRVAISTLGQGDVFGDFSFTAGVPVPPNYFAKALSDAEVSVVSTDDFQALIECHPQIALRLINELSRRLVVAEQKIHDLALSKAEARVLEELRSRANLKGITSALTHEEIAEATGLARETVTRVIAKLKAGECFKVLPRHRYELC